MVTTGEKLAEVGRIQTHPVRPEVGPEVGPEAAPEPESNAMQSALNPSSMAEWNDDRRLVLICIFRY